MSGLTFINFVLKLKDENFMYVNVSSWYFIGSPLKFQELYFMKLYAETWLKKCMPSKFFSIPAERKIKWWMH